MAPEQIKNCDNDGGTTGSDDDRGKTVSNKNILLFFNSSLNSSTDPFPTRGGQILKHDTKLTSNLIQNVTPKGVTRAETANVLFKI